MTFVSEFASCSKSTDLNKAFGPVPYGTGPFSCAKSSDLHKTSKLLALIQHPRNDSICYMTTRQGMQKDPTLLGVGPNRECLFVKLLFSWLHFSFLTQIADKFFHLCGFSIAGFAVL